MCSAASLAVGHAGSVTPLVRPAACIATLGGWRGGVPGGWRGAGPPGWHGGFGWSAPGWAWRWGWGFPVGGFAYAAPAPSPHSFQFLHVSSYHYPDYDFVITGFLYPY